MAKHWWLPLAILCAGAVAVWPLREHLTAAEIAARSPRGKHISVDIFSDEYIDKINAIQLPNTKIKVLQRLLSQAIDEYKKVNRIMGMEFSERLKRVVDQYNNRRPALEFFRMTVHASSVPP